MIGLLKALASLKLPLVGMIVLGLASVAVYKLEHNAAPWLAAPLLLLGSNLIAAVATNGVFRRNTPLLVFHLALITIVLLAAAGRLTYLKGGAEVTEGEAFAGLKHSEAGPLHPWRIDRVHFINEGMEIDYTPGPVRVSTVREWTSPSTRRVISASMGPPSPVPAGRKPVARNPPRRAQSAGSSTQSGPLTSPGPARSAASMIVYA